MTVGGPVVALTHPLAADPTVGGAKAANIARCAGAGLPTLPGFVITTDGCAQGLADPAVVGELRAAWEEIGGAEVTVVVRSSSTIEDAGASSMAGRFTSVLDVRGWPALLEAASRVIASADAVRDLDGTARPIAVLVQEQLDTELGGVMFAVDPVTGDRRHVVVEAVAARPDALVSGVATADHLVLGRAGRVIEHTSAGPVVPLSAGLRRRLVQMAHRASEIFGSPQDIEWAVDRRDRLWLLQSRPVTAVAGRPDRHAAVLGPGPVAETFPDALPPLAIDLWIAPLREGMVRAISATGAVARRRLERSPVLTTVGGRAAVDLGVTGHTASTTGWRQRLVPANIARRLVAAWTVGRLRVALPAIATTVVDSVDRDLAAVPALAELDDAALIDVLDESRHELATVHAYEVLCGMLLQHVDRAATPAPLVALRALARCRADGLPDDATPVAAPAVLALSAPSLTEAVRLPDADAAASPDGADDGRGIEALSHRDALRLRARWIHELQSRTVRELARRTGARGGPTLELLVHLRLDDVRAMVSGRAAPSPADLVERATRPAGAPLPSAFRLAADGRPVPARHHRHASGEGAAAGGGRGAGTVAHRPPASADAAGVVLVVEHLEPSLAPSLTHLAGLVSETGSALSHLAILARESGVPTVVGVVDARRRYQPGMRLLVDGDAGAVQVLASPAETLSPTHEDAS